MQSNRYSRQILIKLDLLVLLTPPSVLLETLTGFQLVK